MPGLPDRATLAACILRCALPCLEVIEDWLNNPSPMVIIAVRRTPMKPVGMDAHGAASCAERATGRSVIVDWTAAHATCRVVEVKNLARLGDTHLVRAFPLLERLVTWISTDNRRQPGQ